MNKEEEEEEEDNEERRKERECSPTCGQSTLFISQGIYKIIGSAQKSREVVVHPSLLLSPWPSSSPAQC